MKKQLLGKLLRSYMKKHRLSFFVHICLLSMITFVLMMNRVPAAVIVYCYWLIIGFTCAYVGYDFWKYYQKEKTISQLHHEVTVSLQRLPEADDLIESHYQQLLRMLYEDKSKLVSQGDTRYSELLDYYTIWVHQIKTPIAAMRLLLQSEEATNHAELGQELFKIEQYVEMVLTYLRIDDMSSDLLLQHYQLSTLIKQAAKKYATMFIHKKISFQLEEMDELILTDEKWFVFVIEQLLSNALKYTTTGTISIYMDKTKEKTLVIEDTGIGIQTEDLPRIFERGFTGYNGRMDKKSTGIGLFLCKQILEKLSHYITIESTVDVGTKVTLDISNDKILLK